MQAFGEVDRIETGLAQKGRMDMFVHQFGGGRTDVASLIIQLWE
jgi:hypothetical protein